MPTPPPQFPRRTALINRNTNETKIQLSLSLDGGPLDLLPATDEFPDDDDDSKDSSISAKGSKIPSQDSKHHASQMTNSQQIWIWTGIGFLDHMLHAWAKHAGWSLRVRVRGDLYSEWVWCGIVLGGVKKAGADVVSFSSEGFFFMAT